MEALLPVALKLIGGSIMIRVLLAVLTILTVYALAKLMMHHWRTRRAFGALPYHPNIHWLWGHAHLFFGDRSKGLQYFVECTKLYPKAHALYLGPLLSVLVVHHPDTVKIVCGPEPKMELFYYPMRPWLGESLLTGSGPKWYRTRRLLTPAFHFDILKPYMKVYCECVDVLLEKWGKVGKDDTVEVFESCSLLALDIMLKCTCSYDSNCQTATKRDPYISAIYELQELILTRILHFPYYFDLIWYLTPHSRRYKKASNLVHQFAMDIITKRRNVLEKGVGIAPVMKGTKQYFDFIDVLLQAKDEDGIGLSNEDIRAEVDTFVFEGHDTTASGLSWTLYNLATYPEHQYKCREEVDALFDQKDSEDLEWDDLNKLEYVSMCIKESLRLYPPVFVTGREMSQDVTFDGHVMPKGTKVLFGVYPLHHHAGVWGDDVEEFNPLRFTTENCKDRDPFAYLPFSAGPRNCIGQNFAMNEEKVAVAKILRRFEIVPGVEGEIPRMEIEVILRAKYGYHVKLLPRNLSH